MTMRLLNTALLNKVPLNKGVLYLACCALAFGLPRNILAQDAAQADPHSLAATYDQARTPTTSKAGEVASAELPDSPGAAWAKAQDASPQQNSSSQPAPPSSTQTGTSQTTPIQATSATDQTQKPQRPVGTAAAEAPKVSGVTAAQPAGVAIAPAKQRRIRTIVLKVGAMVGAGAALGTVIALREATPSKPPGAH